jgi:hypothetical protein
MSDADPDEMAEGRARFAAAAAEFAARHRECQGVLLARIAAYSGDADEALLDAWRKAVAAAADELTRAEDELARALLKYSGQIDDGDPLPHHGFDPCIYRTGDVWLVVAPASGPSGRRYVALTTARPDEFPTEDP